MSEPHFLARWAKKKSEEKTGTEGQKPNQDAGFEAVSPAVVKPDSTTTATSVAVKPVPLPTVESLTAESDFSPFMGQDVAPELRNQAMKKLFTDPHYNVMDRLDTYIDDYSIADPIPESMLRMMTQSATLGLFDHEKEEAKATTAVPDAAQPTALETPVTENMAPAGSLPANSAVEVAAHPAAQSGSEPSLTKQMK